jgi:tetratricopeptide (TPR) repeat protein
MSEEPRKLPAVPARLLSPNLVQRLAESIQQIVTEEVGQRLQAERGVLDDLLRANQEMAAALQRLMRLREPETPVGAEAERELKTLVENRTEREEVVEIPPPPEPAPAPSEVEAMPYAESLEPLPLEPSPSEVPAVEPAPAAAAAGVQPPPPGAAAETPAYDPSEEVDYGAEVIEPEPAVITPAELHFARGEEHQQQNELERAIIAYSVALELDPHLRPAFMARGLAYRARREYERAVADYNTAISLDDGDAEAYLRRGNVFADCGQLEEAISDYTSALERDPRLAAAYMNRGLAHAKRSEFARVLADADAALELEPDSRGALYIRGAAATALRRFDDAIRDFNRLLELDPKNVLAYNERGLAYASQGDYDRAVLDYARALKLNPRLLLARYNRAMAYRLKGEYELAIVGFTEVLRANSKSAQAYFERGLAYLFRGNFDEALADFEAALELNPTLERAREKRDEALRSQARQRDLERRDAERTGETATPPATPALPQSAAAPTTTASPVRAVSTFATPYRPPQQPRFKKTKPEIDLDERRPPWKWVGGGVAAALVVMLFAFIASSRASRFEAPPAATFSSRDLWREFTDDPDYARENYIDKIIQVSGVVKTNDAGAGVVVLKEKNNRSIVCVIGKHEGPFKDILAQIAEGKPATIKGVCEGLQDDSIKLTDCRVISAK